MGIFILWIFLVPRNNVTHLIWLFWHIHAHAYTVCTRYSNIPEYIWYLYSPYCYFMIVTIGSYMFHFSHIKAQSWKLAIALISLCSTSVAFIVLELIDCIVPFKWRIKLKNNIQMLRRCPRSPLDGGGVSGQSRRCLLCWQPPFTASQP